MLSFLTVLLVLAFVVPFASAQTNGFGMGYGWYVGNSTPIPTPVPTETLVPTASPTSTFTPTPTVSNPTVVSPTVPEMNPLIVIVNILFLGLIASLVLKVVLQRKQYVKKLVLVGLALLVCCFFFAGLVSADIGSGWQSGNGWNGVDTPTPSPSATGNPTATPDNSATGHVNYIAGMSFSAFGLIAIVPIISAVGVVVALVMKKPGEDGDMEHDPALVIVAIVTIVAVDVIIIVAVLIVSGIQNAVSITSILPTLLR